MSEDETIDALRVYAAELKERAESAERALAELREAGDGLLALAMLAHYRCEPPGECSEKDPCIVQRMMAAWLKAQEGRG